MYYLTTEIETECTRRCLCAGLFLYHALPNSTKYYFIIQILDSDKQLFGYCCVHLNSLSFYILLVSWNESAEGKDLAESLPLISVYIAVSVMFLGLYVVKVFFNQNIWTQ